MKGERWRVSVASVVAIIAVAIAFLVLGAPGARAAGSAESQLASMTNAARSSAGLPGYAYAADLAAVARHHAEDMAAAGDIYHNPNLGSEVGGWRKVGENVGVGQSADEVHQTFMASSGHRANILSTTYTEIGVGTAIGGDGRLYVTEVFRLPAGQPQAEPAVDPTPPPADEPAPAPAPPDPAPAAEPVPAPPAPPDPVIAPETTPITVTPAAAAAAARGTNVGVTELRTQLVRSVTPVEVTVKRTPPVMWIAALLAQAVLIAHMLVFYRRRFAGVQPF